MLSRFYALSEKKNYKTDRKYMKEIGKVLNKDKLPASQKNPFLKRHDNLVPGP